MILDESPPKPSVAALAFNQGASSQSAAIGAKEIQGDLDTIILKAMHKEPGRRYGSASALADDVENYLAQRPIHARPDSLGYRARKFWDRNRWTVTSAVAAVVLVIALIAFYTARLTTERDTAERERMTANRVSEFMTEVFRVANPNESRGNSVPVREVLDAAVARIDKDLQSEPRVRMALSLKMSQAYVGIGLWKSAQGLLQRAIEQERVAFKGRTIALADALTALAAIQNRLADFKGERASLEEAWEIRRANNAEGDRAAVLTLVALARNQSVRGDAKQALGTLHHAEQVITTLRPHEDAVLGQVFACYGRIYNDAGDYNTAEQYLRKALPLLHGAIEQGADIYSDTALLLVENLTKQNRVAESQSQLHELLADQTTILGPDHPLVGETWNALGISLCESGAYAECSAAFQTAVDIQRKQSSTDTMMLAIGYHNLGTASHDAGDLANALQSFANGQRILRKLRGDRDVNLLPMLGEQAGTLRDAGQLDAADKAITEAEHISAELADGGGVYRGYMMTERGRLTLARKEYVKAIGELHRAIDATAPQESHLLAHAHVGIGQALLATGKCSEAIAEFELALDMRRKSMPPANWFIADAENKLGDALSICGRGNEAESLLTASVEQLQRLRKPDDFKLREAHRQRMAASTSVPSAARAPLLRK
jgi:tetratricopeptide (TPR) repeat protein